MKSDKHKTIQKLYWCDIRKEVAKVEPHFSKLVDEIDPGKDFPLYLVKYPYGAVIVDHGDCYYPLPDGQMVMLKDPRLPAEMRKDLAYTGDVIPAGIVLQNSIELFINPDQQIFPWMSYKAGTIFALWAKLDAEQIYHPTRIFNITSGARSIFMIPNIGDYSLHKNLQRDFNLRLPPPKEMLDQWHVFKALIRHPMAQCDWQCSLLYFSGKWIEKLYTRDRAWIELHRYLLEFAWQRSGYWRNQQFYNHAFSWAQAKRNLKPNPYLADTVKYLLAISAGAISAYKVATDNSNAPIDLLQKIYIESYRIKNYVPTIMCPGFFTLKNLNQHIYYSLQLPSALEFSPKSRKLSTTIHDLRELKHITSVFLDEIKKGSILIDSTTISKVIENVSIDFFHSERDQHEEINLTDLMPKKDPALIYCSVSSKNKRFAETGAFVRGCVSISAKKNN